jgi:hypothetical protein
MGLFGPNYDTDNSLFSGGNNGMPGSNAPGGQTSNQFTQQPRYQSPQPTQGPSSGGSGMMPWGVNPPSTDLQPGDLAAPGDGLKAKADASHQNLVSQGLVPVGNGQYHPMSMYTPDQVQAFMNQYQQQANKLYPNNAVFPSDSPFLQSHPRAAAVINSLLLSGSQARAGATLADSIGVASRMALAPGEYAQQQAQDRARYVAGQTGQLFNQQKSLADINEANARTGLYGAQADYYSGAKTDATNAAIATNQFNADTRRQNQVSLAQNRQDRLNQRQSEFEQSDNFKRWQTQFKAANPASRVNQLDITERQFQAHVGQLQKDMLAKINGRDPLTGLPLSPEQQQGIRQSYQDEIEAESNAHSSLRQWAGNQPQASPSTKTPATPIDLGPANGKAEGSTGVLNGQKVIVRNGRIVVNNNAR